MTRCIFEIKPEEKLGWKLTLYLFTIVLILLWGLSYSVKKKRQQNIGTLILKQGLRHVLATTTGGSEKFHADPVCIFYCPFLVTRNEQLLKVPWILLICLLRFSIGQRYTLSSCCVLGGRGFKLFCLKETNKQLGD